MNGGKKNEHPQQKGLFLFFLAGLFLLQISFAFTIHGDIGPQASLNQKLQRVAPPQLMGKIDSILQPETNETHAVTAARKPGIVPAAAKADHTPIIKKAVASAKAKMPSQPLSLKAKDERFFEYTITGGDTLGAISRKLCGSGKMVNALIRANRLQNERTLRCGEHLLIPRSMIAKN
mgnify:CR=1 FL=1